MTQLSAEKPVHNMGGHKPARKRVTISQLADALGLTKGTVSRALNGYPDISDGTRQRVERQAERMGYRPLGQAQGIRTGRTRSLGLVLQMNVHDAQRPFLADFIAGISQTAAEENWSLSVATAGSKPEMLDAMERLIDERKADGSSCRAPWSRMTGLRSAVPMMCPSCCSGAPAI